MVATSQIRKDAKQAAKAAKNTIVRNLCSQINKLKGRSGGAIKHGVIKQLIATIVDAVSQLKITRYNIRHMQVKMANEVIQTNVLPPGCNQKNGPEPLLFASSLANQVVDQKDQQMIKSTINEFRSLPLRMKLPAYSCMNMRLQRETR